jgi:hypothetical protein
VAAAQTQVAEARAAVEAAATPTERARAARELEVAQERLAVTSEGARTSAKRPSAQQPSSRSSDAAVQPRSAPETLPTDEPEGQRATIPQAFSYVEQAVPGRSTALLIALAGGIVALLVLIAREWSR